MAVLAGNGTARRRDWRAERFCVHLVADERQIPVYAVEYKAPDKVTIPELVAGLHPMNLARDVIEQEGDTLEFMPTRLVVAMVAQIFLYMIDSGIRYSTATSAPDRRSFSFIYRGADVQADDEVRLHRTAIGQVLAFTLQALAVEPPTQKWHDVAHDQLTNWKVKYLDVFCSSSSIVNCPHHL
ncbi:hypothetical protein CBS147323_11169 [Aspergillus niger]|nr:hypothetical protein CBS11852_11299 [Aspergillus niger]KAI2947538.1 hypothetical protein CBS147323_11169 [Aspergillus niger]